MLLHYSITGAGIKYRTLISPQEKLDLGTGHVILDRLRNDLLELAIASLGQDLKLRLGS